MKLQRALLRTTWQAGLGGLASCLATILGGLAGMVMVGDDAGEIGNKLGILAEEAARLGKLNALLAAPVIETLFFYVAFKLLWALRIARHRRAAILAMALAMGVVGWLLHEVRDSIVAQSFGFAVLGALFAALWFQSGGIVAFVGTALAHSISNASVLALALVYSPQMVWEGRVQHRVSGNTRIDIIGDFESLDQCRRAGLLRLQRLKASQQPDSRSGITCERAIRSSW